MSLPVTGHRIMSLAMASSCYPQTAE